MHHLEKIFFFHNPKAGGAFLLEIIEALHPGKRSPNVENDVADHDALSGDYCRFRGFDVYAGHYGRDVYDTVAEGHAAITNFRHPLRRIVSLYNYFRLSVSLPDDVIRRPAFDVVREAKLLSFEDFVRSANAVTKLYVSNMHTRQLTHSLYSNVIYGLNGAKAFVDAMPWFFLAEQPVRSLTWAQFALGWPPIVNRQVNASATSGDGHMTVEAIDPQTLAVVTQNNALDIGLYEHAVRRFEQHAPPA